MNDLINYTMQRACIIFGGNDGIFNSASFSQAIQKVTGVKSLMDGVMVSAIMCGRSDVEVMAGGSHYRRVE